MRCGTWKLKVARNIALRSLPPPVANIVGSISSGLLPVNQAAKRCNIDEDSGT